MQVPPTQQLVAVVQASPAQHGMPEPPHAVAVPWKQTMPPIAPPEATQVDEVASQQPPPEHMLPGQHAWPGAPHSTQVPPLHEPPVPHVAASAMQRLVVGSQQPPLVQVELAQHTWLVPPHKRQVPLSHA
jgi:hypothetical protein